MQSTYWAAGALAVILFVGCGGDDKPRTFVDDPPSRGGSRSTGGKGGGNEAGEAVGGNDGETGGPVVTITSPAEAKSPDEGVVSSPTLRVLCTVKESSAAVDAGSVTISATDSAGQVLEQKGSATGEEDEYEADIVLTTAPSGKLTLACAAQDRDGAKRTDTITTFLDRGPAITIISPEPDSAHPLKGGLDVTFTVAAVPLSDSDAGAEVSEVIFSLDGKECVVGADECQVEEVSPGKFHTVFALEDTNQFPVSPSGAIKISAANSRTPEPVVATESYNVLVDGLGPVINIESPPPQKVVGGKVALVFTVVDTGSGVDPETVNVALYPDGPPQLYDPNKGWSRDGNRFTFVFDTKEVEKAAKVQTTINVRASDRAGNPSGNGQSIQLYLDNVPPTIDLDPKNVRVRAGGSCSGSFDPVGPAALGDLDGQLGSPIVNPIAFFRAFVDEQTNSQEGQSLFYHAGTDQGQVRLYIQADPANQATKLLVNKNPNVDNTCDDIGGIDDLVGAPAFSTLKPMDAARPLGAVWNRIDPEIPPVVGDACTLSTGLEPPHLCPGTTSDMWYVPFFTAIKEPHVYVVGTPNPNDASCSGIDLAFLTTDQPDGWVCAAARVVDNAGNVGISPPLRLCVDKNDGSPPACRVSSTVPPSCTDGCTPPTRGGGILIPG